ncbi:hypothetical protein [Streptomyces sp. NBC_01207]|uniref:hypothetical protein n=1 Tax=Streptomyces sp. NBC_01207 TaxID=2903772 RepID=UPI002E1110DD|nr:hypothetical protein OG457_49295 [Streptomyces sp. NBC_01207]
MCSLVDCGQATRNGVEMRSARNLGRSLAIAAGTAVLAGLVPGVIPADTASAADACGNAFTDYAGTFTGTVLQGDGPEQLNYTIEFGGQQYTSTMVVSNVNTPMTGSYQAQGFTKILTVQSIGNVVLTVPHWHTDNRVSFEEVKGKSTQCQSGALPGGGTASPPTVTSFVIRPMDGAEIVMIRQT